MIFEISYNRCNVIGTGRHFVGTGRDLSLWYSNKWICFETPVLQDKGVGIFHHNGPVKE